MLTSYPFLVNLLWWLLRGQQQTTYLNKFSFNVLLGNKMVRRLLQKAEIMLNQRFTQAGTQLFLA
jgi:hypothetical protein